MIPAVSPRSLDRALELLAEAPAGTRLVAGGTDLMVQLHHGAPAPSLLVDVWRVDELRGIALDGDRLVLGALTTFGELMTDDTVRARLPILADIGATIGAAQTQNRATVGGNLANASPAADLPPVLSVLDAELMLRTRTAERRVSIHDFFLGPRRTCLHAGELIVRVSVPLPRPAEEMHFRKIGTRRAQAISKVVIAAGVRRSDGVVVELRAAAGSVAPTVCRLRTVEALVARGKTPSRDELGAAVAADIAPIDDLRGSASYRSRATANVIARLVSPQRPSSS